MIEVDRSQIDRWAKIQYDLHYSYYNSSGIRDTDIVEVKGYWKERGGRLQILDDTTLRGKPLWGKRDAGEIY